MSQNGQHPDDIEDPAPDESEVGMIMGENTATGDSELHDELVSNFVASEDDYLEKSHLTAEQVPLIAAWLALARSDDDLTDDTQELMEDWIGWFLQGKIAVDGRGREDFIRAFETLGSQASAGPVVLNQDWEPGEKDEEEEDSKILGIL